MTIKAIKHMDEMEFAHFFKDLREAFLEDPLKYFVKNKKIINFEPTPAQTVALKCIFGQKLDAEIRHKVYIEDLTENEFDLGTIDLTEVALFELMTGFDYDGDLVKARNRINLIVGRRGGKSTLASIVALFSTVKVNWKPFLRKTPVATVAILSHSVDFSQEILDILKGMVDDSEILTRLRDTKRKNTQSTFHLKIPFIIEKDGKEDIEYSKVAVKIGAASKKTTRGRAVCTLLCDEIAFWNLADNAAESDTDILRAIRPSLLQFGEHGTIIKLSSPGIKQGILYDEWYKRVAIKDDYIQFKAPSWVWNTILPVEEFKKEWRLDPDGFDTEFRANFVDSISNFILPEFVDMCVSRGVHFIPPSIEKNVIYSAAIDAAFKSDRFAFALVGNNEHRITTHVIKYWEGSRKDPVKAFEVAKYIRTICKQFGISQVVADQYSFQPLREIFQTYGVTLVENTFTLPLKRKIYFGLKRLIHNQNVDLLDVPLLHKEIKELQVEQTPNGQIRIGHPQGGSDDLADALAVACFNSMEKSGTMGIIMGEVASGRDSRVRTDVNGRAFTAPSAEMLEDFKGFRNVLDNSAEWVKDPETKQWVKRSDLEEEDVLGTSGPNFSF